MTKKLSAVILVSVFTCSMAAHAGIFTSSAAELAEKLFVALSRASGREAVEEIAEYGGRKALRETIEKVSEEYGESAAKKFVGYGERFGLRAIRVMERDPAMYIKAFDNVPENILKKAIWASEREPEAMSGLVKKFGSDALVVAARHRGTGVTILETLGDDGIRLSKALSERQGITLAKNAEDIAGLSARNRANVIKKILSAPGRVIDYLDNIPGYCIRLSALV